jgi:hypothetical protein
LWANPSQGYSGLGARKGLHGAGLFLATPSHIISKRPIRHLEDFKGKKLRVFASDFQFEALKRLGATPVAVMCCRPFNRAPSTGRLLRSMFTFPCNFKTQPNT